MKTRRTLSIRTSIWPIFFLIFFLHAGLATAIANKQAEEPILLRVGYLPVLSQLPLIVSYDRERLSYQKVRVELTSFKSYIALEAAFRVKAIDIAYLPIPTIFAMKAEGIDVVIGNSLHRGGSSLVIDPDVKEKKDSGTVYGIPGPASIEVLILHNSLTRAGLSYGDDFKVIAMQLDRAIDELEQGNVDGLLLPEPYPTMASSRLAPKVQWMQPSAGDLETPQAALVFNRIDIVGGSNSGGLLEWLDGIDRACHFLEQDIQNYGGAQTILTQQLYFGFKPTLIRQAFSNLQFSLMFSSKKAPLPALEEILKKMYSLKLLQRSININEILLDQYLPR